MPTVRSTVFPDATPLLAKALEAVKTRRQADILVHHGLPDRSELIRRLQGHAGVLNNESFYDEEVLEACPDLKVIVFLGTGASSYIDIPACERRGVRVRNVVRYGDRTVAEHTIALLFAVYRDIAEQHHAMRTGAWLGTPIGELDGKRLGIVGLGGIGLETARIGQALGMDVVGWSRSSRTDAPCATVELDQLLETSDVVSLHLELNGATQGFLNAERLRKMKRGSVLINSARAALVDESEVVAMLRDGHLAGAGVDVYRSEPLPADASLRLEPKLTLTCHTGWQSPEAVARLMEAAVSHLNEEMTALG